MYEQKNNCEEMYSERVKESLERLKSGLGNYGGEETYTLDQKELFDFKEVYQ